MSIGDREREREGLIEIASQLATPVDFGQLEADQVLKRAGAWWRVLDGGRVPKHAQRQVIAVKTPADGKGILVRFSRGHKTAAKLHERLTRKRNR